MEREPRPHLCLLWEHAASGNNTEMQKRDLEGREAGRACPSGGCVAPGGSLRPSLCEFSHSQWKLKPKSLGLRSKVFSCTPDPQGLKASTASVELNQSAFLSMTSCLQPDSLDSLLEKRLGPGLGGCFCFPGCCPFTPRGGTQGPCSYHFSQNQDTPQTPGQR